VGSLVVDNLREAGKVGTRTADARLQIEAAQKVQHVLNQGSTGKREERFVAAHAGALATGQNEGVHGVDP
jgi:hypothetical protein